MPSSNAQRAMEISSRFLLDQIKFGRRLFDFLDALIVVAVTQANVDQLMRSPEQQRAYATYDSPPPDALRRPISINALAQSLRLPFETVRRRTSRLVLLGVLRAGRDGIWTPSARVRTSLHRKVAEAGYARLLALHAQLVQLPELQGLPHGKAWVEPPPLRAAARISSEYLLRVVDLLTVELGDPLDAAIWSEILRSNSAAVSAQGEVSPGRRQPVRGSAVAKRLGLPAETVRRRASHLVSIGACEHTSTGLLITDEILARPEYVRVRERHLTDLRRMFASLAQLGVLQGDAERLPAAA